MRLEDWHGVEEASHEVIWQLARHVRRLPAVAAAAVVQGLG
jgi:hypothetical protein